MTCQTEFDPQVLGPRIKVKVQGRPDFRQAQELALEAAREKLQEPMILGWYDAARGRFWPQVECCGEDKPSWVIYAQSRGGDVAVEVEGGYFFIMAEGSVG